MVKKVAATGFGAEPQEKVFRLMALLAVPRNAEHNPPAARVGKGRHGIDDRPWRGGYRRLKLRAGPFAAA